ncbi:TonB-dependent receptor plug domain-containing protein [Flavobacterium sp.]|uniref:TonB-dependent receptor plug domain-containing protein n=1 Tax=Flavobacterium sp. TaxID=239 RepID=UPI00375374A4
MFKKIIIIISLLFSLFIYSQQNFNLSGKVKSSDIYLPEVLLELKINQKSKFAVSSDNGDFKFTNINCVLNDTVIIKVNYTGYKEFIKEIIILQEEVSLDIDLENSNFEYLKEVIIKGTDNVIRNANKSSYKINQKKFIKNAKATAVLGTIPNVYCNKESGETLVEGNLKAKIFIDGVEAMPNEIKNINATSIDRVEIMNNPSSIYGTDFLGAIINIVSKKSNEQFFKGYLRGTGGIKNNYWSISPSIVYKKGILSFDVSYSNLQNNQISTNDLNRNDLNGSYVQSFLNNSKVIQNSFNSRLGLNFSEKSNLSITGYKGGYKVKGDINGTSNFNFNNFSSYNNLDETINNDLEISTVYKYKTSLNNTLYLKNKYTITNNQYNSKYNINQFINYVDVKSQNKELAYNLSYDMLNLKLFKKNANITYDFKYIDRNYSFSDTDFYVNQDVYNATFEMSNQWTEKFSTQSSFTYEYSSNKSDFFSKNYNLIFPTFNVMYHFKNKIDSNIGYSRRVLRPSPSDLNETLIIYSPGVASKGNSNLEQQIRDYYFIKFNKEIKTNNYSVKFYNSKINNSILNIYEKQGNLIVRTVDNAAKSTSTGIELGYTTELFKKISLNIDSGINYNLYETDDISSLIKKNSGVGFNSNLNIYTNLFKEKLSVSISGIYDNPNYSLLSKRVTYPYLDFSASTNLFKERLELSFYIQNLLGNNATTIRETSFSDNFQESRISRNNFTNFLLTLTYNFGKRFEDYNDDKNIENNDIRK